MELIKAPQVLSLVDLSPDQLREWTGRRALISADVKPKGSGSPALYSWQTVLVLRIAVVLKDNFKIELQAHRELFGAIRQALTGVSFPSLWGMSLVLHEMRKCELIDYLAPAVVHSDVLVIRLDPHLEVLSEGFGISARMEQLPLFPALGVS